MLSFDVFMGKARALLLNVGIMRHNKAVVSGALGNEVKRPASLQMCGNAEGLLEPRAGLPLLHCQVPAQSSLTCFAPPASALQPHTSMST